MLYEWTPELAESFASLAYLGPETVAKWLTDSPQSSQLEGLIYSDGHITAVDIWRKALNDNASLEAPVLLLILEHLRRHPAELADYFERIRWNFSITLANVAFRAADALYEDAKASFVAEEIDTAITRFSAALSEFRFAIESSLLSDATMRIATGKYATAVAMIGRWVNVSPEVLSRALSYSHESMALGNLEPESLNYRLELLVVKFDQTGDHQLLRNALNLVSNHENIAEGSELAEAETRFRIALISESGSRDARRYLKTAKQRLDSFRPRSGIENARCNVLSVLIEEATNVRSVVTARSMAIPRGLLSMMATGPSVELWITIRRVVQGLESLRINRGSLAAAVLGSRLLRQIVNGPIELLDQNDLSRYLETTGWLAEKAPLNRHIQWEAGAALLSAAIINRDTGLALKARDIFESLAAVHSSWPLPRIGIARALDFLASIKQDAEPSVNSWCDAARLALNSTMYARSNLGGRNEVFAVDDARGFLSETFVFKKMTKSKADHEASMLNVLRGEIEQLNATNRFEVPSSLAVVEIPVSDERRWVHVSQRAAGRLVSDLSAEEASDVLEMITDFLVIFHRAAGKPAPEKSAWRSLKAYFKMWSKTLFEAEHAGRFVASLHSCFPGNLPLVRKRDGHASNWLVDPAGRIVAIDLESDDFIPMGYDVVQLIEDNALVQANQDGWYRRLEIMKRYFNGMEHQLSDSELSSVYGWFALTRALRLGTEKEAGKQLRRHARELCGLLVEFGHDEVKSLARELLQALSRIEHGDINDSATSHDHRRLSKAMAYQLRHHGPQNGVSIDRAGFALMEDLALTLKTDISNLLAVAEHPGEPRFEVREGHIRALYGHSLDVTVEAGIKVGTPTSLYHGSSWSVLNAIIKNGLLPMRRQFVHLTNIAEEAMAVGERKGAPIIFAVDQSDSEEPVAEGIWVTAKVSPHRLTIVNPFIQEGGIVR
jgi:RNA:NAD 2'-phosphotransferase (TPT1/KptA family)/tetratricopeptide (TPR) repeat protein